MKLNLGNIVRCPDDTLGMITKINIFGVHVLCFNTGATRVFMPERLEYIRRSLIVNPMHPFDL